MKIRIDTRNGGQTCYECRYYKLTHMRNDPFFGRLPSNSWCIKTGGVVKPDKGQDCPFFLKKVFTRE